MSKYQCPHCQGSLPEPVEIIPVGIAIFCADCNAVVRAANDHCPACGSRSLVSLEILLRAKSCDSCPAPSTIQGPGVVV